MKTSLIMGAGVIFVGVGFHSGGFSYSPAAGLSLAEMVTNLNLSIDLRAFSTIRFDADDTEQYLAFTITQQQIFHRRN